MKSMREVNLDTYNLSLLTAKEDILNPRSSTNWALFSYDGIRNRLKLADSGVGGLKELTTKLHPRLPLYGMCRVGTAQPRIVMILWVGNEVDEYRRAECASHIPAIRTFFKEVHIFLPARTLDEITEERICTLACNAAVVTQGSKVRPGRRMEDRQTTVGTNYKRTIAAAEIQRIQRDSFWAQAEREEEERKKEEQRRAAEDRRQRERERMLQEKKEAMERERRMNEKEQKIKEQRRIQTQMETEARKQEKMKWEQQERQREEEDMRARYSRSESGEKAAEAAALVSQRVVNPREFFRQLSSSSVQTASHPNSPYPVRSPFRRLHRSQTDSIFSFNESPSSTPTSPNRLSPYFPSTPTTQSPTIFTKTTTWNGATVSSESQIQISSPKQIESFAVSSVAPRLQTQLLPSTDATKSEIKSPISDILDSLVFYPPPPSPEQPDKSEIADEFPPPPPGFENPSEPTVNQPEMLVDTVDPLVLSISPSCASVPEPPARPLPALPVAPRMLKDLEPNRDFTALASVISTVQEEEDVEEENEGREIKDGERRIQEKGKGGGEEEEEEERHGMVTEKHESETKSISKIMECERGKEQDRKMMEQRPEKQDRNILEEPECEVDNVGKTVEEFETDKEDGKMLEECEREDKQEGNIIEETESEVDNAWKIVEEFETDKDGRMLEECKSQDKKDGNNMEVPESKEDKVRKNIKQSESEKEQDRKIMEEQESEKIQHAKLMLECVQEKEQYREIIEKHKEDGKALEEIQTEKIREEHEKDGKNMDAFETEKIQHGNMMEECGKENVQYGEELEKCEKEKEQGEEIVEEFEAEKIQDERIKEEHESEKITEVSESEISKTKLEFISEKEKDGKSMKTFDSEKEQDEKNMEVFETEKIQYVKFTEKSEQENEQEGISLENESGKEQHEKVRETFETEKIQHGKIMADNQNEKIQIQFEKIQSGKIMEERQQENEQQDMMVEKCEEEHESEMEHGGIVEEHGKEQGGEIVDTSDSEKQDKTSMEENETENIQYAKSMEEHGQENEEDGKIVLKCEAEPESEKEQDEKTVVKHEDGKSPKDHKTEKEQEWKIIKEYESEKVQYGDIIDGREDEKDGKNEKIFETQQRQYVNIMEECGQETKPDGSILEEHESEKEQDEKIMQSNDGEDQKTQNTKNMLEHENEKSLENHESEKEQGLKMTENCESVKIKYGAIIEKNENEKDQDGMTENQHNKDNEEISSVNEVVTLLRKEESYTEINKNKSTEVVEEVKSDEGNEKEESNSETHISQHAPPFPESHGSEPSQYIDTSITETTRHKNDLEMSSTDASHQINAPTFQVESDLSNLSNQRDSDVMKEQTSDSETMSVQLAAEQGPKTETPITEEDELTDEERLKEVDNSNDLAERLNNDCRTSSPEYESQARIGQSDEGEGLVPVSHFLEEPDPAMDVTHHQLDLSEHMNDVGAGEEDIPVITRDTDVEQSLKSYFDPDRVNEHIKREFLQNCETITETPSDLKNDKTTDEN